MQIWYNSRVFYRKLKILTTVTSVAAARIRFIYSLDGLPKFALSSSVGTGSACFTTLAPWLRSDHPATANFTYDTLTYHACQYTNPISKPDHW
jgi:predicted exporter